MKQSVNQMLAKAKSHHKKGELAPAQDAYRAILEKFPNNSRAREGLAALSVAPKSKGQTQPTQEQINSLISLLQHGQFNDLLRQTGALIRQFPKTLVLYSLQGAANSGLGRIDAAIANFKATLGINPKFADGHTNLGNMLLEKGEIEGAIECYQRSLAIKQDLPETHSNLGNALQKNGDVAGAIASYRRAIELRPQYAEAYCNMALAQGRLGDIGNAIESYEAALRIQPNNPETHMSLGVLLKENDSLDDAIASYENAANIAPDFPEVLNNLGLALAEKGMLREATEQFERALEINPELAECYLNISRTTSFAPDNIHLKKMRELTQSETLSDADRIFLGFALGKAENDVGEFEAGFKQLTSANSLRHRQIGYDISKDSKLFDTIKTYFDGDYQRLRPAIRDTDQPTPIFVLGMPRSGSTLVEQIISSHSNVFGAGERGIAEQAISESNWQNQSDRSVTIDIIRSVYLDGLSKLSDAPMITDKTLHNIKWIGFLMNALPEAKFVHVTRNPAAICWSNFKTYFPSSGMGFTYGLEDIARYYKLYVELMEYWCRKFPDRIYDLNYDDLTESQEFETRNLFQFLELDWENQVLEFHKNKRQVSTASNAQIRQKMYRGSSQDWKNYERWLQPMLKILDA